MIQRVGDWLRLMLRRSDSPNDVQDQLESIEHMVVKVRTEHRVERLRAELERLRLIEQARRGS